MICSTFDLLIEASSTTNAEDMILNWKSGFKTRISLERDMNRKADEDWPDGKIRRDEFTLKRK